uniref:Uncharacterized protein n=1 Tax=Aquila chrysaetos chrysaetos TaxID=223781 RepID=A0A663DMR3_AQUCH
IPSYALSGPEKSYRTGKWLQHVPLPLEISIQGVWFPHCEKGRCCCCCHVNHPGAL